jgi:hypothetical protein
MSSPAQETSRLSHFLARLRPLLPWVSLAIGLTSALLADRSPRRAGAIAAAALLGWILQVGLLLSQQVDPTRFSGRWTTLARAARFSSMAATQALVQQPLFFSLPFYARAATGGAGQTYFLGAQGLAVAVTLWDPLSQALLTRPWPALTLQGLACFSGLNAVLPILGVSNASSLWASAGATALGVPLVAMAGAQPGLRLRAVPRSLIVALCFPAALSFPVFRAAIPAAPLRLASLAIGTRLEGRHLVDPSETIEGPSQLVCHSALFAPRGLNDAVEHVWRKDDARVDRIAVTVRGEPGGAFRTYSIKKNLGDRPSGRWTCTVETESGQVLGEVATRVTR